MLCASKCSAPNCRSTLRADGGCGQYQHPPTTRLALIKQVTSLRTPWHNQQTSPLFSAAAKSLPSLPKNDFIPKFDPGKKIEQSKFFQHNITDTASKQASKERQLKTVITSNQKKKNSFLVCYHANLPDQGSNWRGRIPFFSPKSLIKERGFLVFPRGVFIFRFKPKEIWLIVFTPNTCFWGYITC